MGEINSFPIQTKIIDDLDIITNDQSSQDDFVIIYDESDNVWKKQTLGERDKSKLIPIDSIAEFPSLETDSYSNRQQFSLGSFAPNGEIGGGIMLWEPDLPKSLHDGVNYFSPTVPIPADFNNPADVQNYLDGVGEEWPAGDGIFVLNYFVSREEFEAVENRQFDTPAQAALASLTVGAKYSTKGAITVGDGGHGTFIQSATAPTAIDGFSCFESANGTFGVLQPVNGCVDIHQFGVGVDMAPALLRADAYCQATGATLTGSGTAELGTQVTISAPSINLLNFHIKLANAFPSAVGVIYQAMTNDLNSKTNVKLSFDGNYANQVIDVIALRVRATPNAPKFEVRGDQCNTLLNINGNVERGHFIATVTNSDIFVLEDGDSPDTNVIEINGGQFDQVYVRTASTTSDVRINCQSQKAGSTSYAIQDNGNRFLKVSGELRALTYGAVRVGDDAAFTRQSADATVFDLHIQSAANAGVPLVDIYEANNLQGKITISFGHYQPFKFRDVISANFEMHLLDCDYVGYHVIFGDQATAKACQGNYRIVDRGSVGGAKSALFDRVGEINVYFDGSALPIDISSTVTSDVINMSVERAYITNGVAITHNGVRANVHYRGQQLTPAITGYLTAVGTAGIPRGANVWNVNTNSLNFFDGTVWKYAPTTTTLV